MLAMAGMGGLMALAAGPGAVVINEVAWAGSNDSSSDEWIELYNTTGAAIDLSGWYIEDDASTVYRIGSGVIGPRGYFLIEDNEDAINVAADAVIGLSLANTGDSLVLNDSSGVQIDAANLSGGIWPAGNLTPKASMERVQPGGDIWASAAAGNGALGSAGSVILGTPGSINSAFEGDGSKIYFENQGGGVFAIKADGVKDLYAYGVDILYDPARLKYVEAENGEFLGSDGVATSFNAAMENGSQGVLLVGGARLDGGTSGVNGNGILFKLHFDVLDGGAGGLKFGAASFAADVDGDMPIIFEGSESFMSASGGNSVLNFEIIPGEQRYSLQLQWDAPGGGAESYRVEKLLNDGSFASLGVTTATNFVDDRSLVPGVEYSYKVIPINNGADGAAVETKAVDDRGIRGDIDRSDRVDGRDMEKLARSYGSRNNEEGFDFLGDLNFDGMIDGKDLIDIGVNFGLVYEE